MTTVHVLPLGASGLARERLRRPQAGFVRNFQRLSGNARGEPVAGAAFARSLLPIPYTARAVSTRPASRGTLNCPVAMPPSSLEDRVRELCAQVAAAKTEAELRVILPQLQAAIQDHISYLRAIAVEVIPEIFRKDKTLHDPLS